MAISWVEATLAAAVGIGLAAAVGLRVFVPLLLLGAAGRLGWIELSADFAWLSSTPGLIALAVATLLEVAGYYLPAFDNALDLVAGPAAVLAGIVTLAAVTSDLPTAVRWGLAIIAGGGTAGLVQGLTSMARLKSTGLTGGLGNPVLATVELVGSAVLALLALLVPLLAIALLAAAVALLRRVRARSSRAPTG